MRPLRTAIRKLDILRQRQLFHLQPVVAQAQASMLRMSLSGDWNPREALTQLERRSPERNNRTSHRDVWRSPGGGGRGLLGRDVNSVTRADGLAGGFDTCH